MGIFFKKKKSEREKERENERIAYHQKKELVLKKNKVMSVHFQCCNCRKEWSFDYPVGVTVGRNRGFGFVQDDFSYDRSLYDYDCPNCNNSQVEITKREPIA